MHLTSTSSEAPQSSGGVLTDNRFRGAFIAVTVLFFLWALPNNLNDILIRQFMKSFEITRLQAGLVQSAFYMGYFLMSLPAALVLRRFGYRVGLICGLLLYATGAFMFLPPAIVGSYGFFLFALFTIAAGLAFLETGAGAFIVQLRDAATSERRLNLSQAFNPPGTIAGALIGTVFIFSGVELNQTQVAAMQSAGTYNAYLHSETMRVIFPYLALGVMVLIVALVIGRVRMPESLLHRSTESPAAGNFGDLIQKSHLRNAVIAQFFYVGAQVGSWSYLIQYALDYTGRSEKAAGYLLSVALLLFAVGRFVSTLLMRSIKPQTLLAVFAVAACVLTLIAVLLPNSTGMVSLLASSFFMSLMYPTIFALGTKNLGDQTTMGASFIVMAIVGGAVVTPMIGWVAVRTHNMAASFTVVCGCFLVVVWYGLIGYRRKSADNTTL